MTATDVMRELGDPDKLCGLEDHIVLKFTEPWQPSRMTASAELPTGLHFEDGGLRITATAESFVKNCGIICQRRVVAALFAGCAELRSCGPLASAARKVLSSAETLVIVHNRDYVVNLVDWFRSVEVLVLHHDLKRQALPEGWKMPEGPSLPQLKRLIGNTPGLGLGNLYMLPATIYALACGCPQLYEVQTSMHEVLDPMNTLLDTMLTLNPPLLTSPSLVLGMCMERLDGRTFTPRACDITPFLMTRARENFRGVRRLEVCTWRLDSVPVIRRFTDVTDLTLSYVAGSAIPFWRLYEDVLMQLRLEHLTLRFISDIRLWTIARNWPDLQSLSLVECSVANEQQEILRGSLQSLVSLRLCFSENGAEVEKRAVNMLLNATTQLATLRLEGAVLCALFLDRCSMGPFPSLQHLTLATDKPLPGLGLTGDDLQCLVGALPSLRYAATDSYDLRLFFQHYMPAVMTGWCHCTTCAAEFPRLDDDQKTVWNNMNAKV
ncbi:hypothetical protein V5799_034458 [Amblyomma americanum]|uniref:Uncharacterized protein n=1 Tax=Amblyomma americanum TaxID=6943 RepID=A0AAQ4DKE2_AMBAM